MKKNISNEVASRRVVRSLNGKDKRSKICTAKGSRDRRIRLSANTAIQFYDVQDRLGFDRPSNAIDWLMKEAKAAIDLLNADQYPHLHELLLPETANCVFNLSEAFHRTPGDHIQEDMVQDQINGFNKSQFEIVNSRNRCQSRDDDIQIPVVQDSDVQSSTILRQFSWNPNFNEAEGFEFGNREPLKSSFHPPERYGLLGVSFEQGIQVQEEEIREKEDDRRYDQGYMF